MEDKLSEFLLGGIREIDEGSEEDSDPKERESAPWGNSRDSDHQGKTTNAATTPVDHPQSGNVAPQKWMNF
ncbi:MAG: hypothetical protein ABSH28_08020 [Acidobacteriota bacterium]